MEYYSAIKRKAFESVLMRWMKIEPIIQSEKMKVKVAQLCPILQPRGLQSPWSSPGHNTGESCHLQGIFRTQGSNPGLPHCRLIVYQLSHKSERKR